MVLITPMRPREVINDLDAERVEVVDDVRLPSAIKDTVEHLAAQRSVADALRAEVAGTTRRTASQLRELGLSTRDVGEILGISGARVAQIDRDPR